MSSVIQGESAEHMLGSCGEAIVKAASRLLDGASPRRKEHFHSTSTVIQRVGRHMKVA
jgi:hypothetical protein